MAQRQRLQYLEEIAPSTKRSYQLGLRSFFKVVYDIVEKDDEKVDIDLNKFSDKYFEDKRNVEEDIGKFLIALKERPPKSQRLFMSIIRTFFVENDVELPDKYWRRASKRIHGNGARTDDKVPTNEELKRLIMNMPLNGKALFLTLASSGIRIGEALSLEMDDIYLNEVPARIHIRGENSKNGNGRTTFVSSEAKELLEEYLQNRDRYLDIASKRSRFGKNKEDKRLFPFEQTTAQVLWTGAIDKSNLNGRDKGTNRHVFHPHVLRKFFRSKMSQMVQVDIVEALMGHAGYLTSEYRKYSDEDLAKAYTFGESTVMVFGNVEKVTELQQTVETTKNQLQNLVNGLVTENLALKQRVNQIEEGWKKQEFLYNKLEKIIGEKEAEMEVFRAFLAEDKKRKELRGRTTEECS